MKGSLYILALLIAPCIYAQDGSYIALRAPQFPSYATAGVQSGTATWTWQDGITTWYSPTSFTLTVNVTDGNSHQITLYAKDDDQRGRVETIAQSGGPTQTLQNFAPGVTTNWLVPPGATTFTITHVGANGPNAVLTSVTFLTSTKPPPGPGHFIIINWTPVVGATSYRIYRSGMLLVQVTAPPYTDKTIVGGQFYSYSVSSVNSAGESSTATITQFGAPAP